MRPRFDGSMLCASNSLPAPSAAPALIPAAASVFKNSRRDAEAFLALFDDVKNGDEVVIRSDARGQIWVDTHGQSRKGPLNQRLSHDIWAIWMGDKPISADMKKAMIDRVDSLGR